MSIVSGLAAVSAEAREIGDAKAGALAVCAPLSIAMMAQIAQ
jgi:hypothetical protein